MFILDYRNDRQKANLSSCFIWVQNGSQSSRDNTQHQKPIWPRKSDKLIVQWWFKKFCQGGERLEDEECSGWSLKVDSDQLRAIIQADPLTITQEVAEELNVEHSMAFGIWNKLERWKSSISGCLMGWLKNKKIIILKCHLLFCTTTNHFSIGSWCARKSRFYMTPGDDQLSAWAEKKLQSTYQSQTCTRKKVMIMAW